MLWAGKVLEILDKYLPLLGGPCGRIGYNVGHGRTDATIALLVLDKIDSLYACCFLDAKLNCKNKQFSLADV